MYAINTNTAAYGISNYSFQANAAMYMMSEPIIKGMILDKVYITVWYLHVLNDNWLFKLQWTILLKKIYKIYTTHKKQEEHGKRILCSAKHRLNWLKLIGNLSRINKF